MKGKRIIYCTSADLWNSGRNAEVNCFPYMWEDNIFQNKSLVSLNQSSFL